MFNYIPTSFQFSSIGGMRMKRSSLILLIVCFSASVFASDAQDIRGVCGWALTVDRFDVSIQGGKGIINHSVDHDARYDGDFSGWETTTSRLTYVKTLPPLANKVSSHPEAFDASYPTYPKNEVRLVYSVSGEMYRFLLTVANDPNSGKTHLKHLATTVGDEVDCQDHQ